jgi:poly(A) polymerase
VSALVPLTEEQRAHFSWLTAPYLEKVIGALVTAEPGAARFVGGCVRDSLLGTAPKDFDVATPLTPEAASAALKAAGLGVAPTGIDHGTVTAIADHKGVEVTTLRADVSTDGRRATVAFTRDWAVDAGRRDFTVNAIYLTPDGRLYDPVGGVADVAAKRVRFIGDPEARIREDYLRILRFFRFSARFCETFDVAGLAACAALKDGMKQLSAERIGAEMSGILALPRASFALQAMDETGILVEVFDADADLEAAARMKNLDASAPAPLMLAALYGEAGSGVGARLRLSNAEKAMRSRAVDNAGAVAADMTAHAIRERLYRIGRDGFSDALLTAAAWDRIGEADYARLRALAEAAMAPEFAISGRHALDAGVSPGPQVSQILAAVEAQWIAEDFPSADRQQAILEAEIAKRRR